MMTARKRVRPLPIQQLAVRHSVDHSSSDYFSPDDSARDPSSYSSSEASSDLHSDASSDSSSRHSLSDHYSPDLPSTSAGPSRKRRRDSSYLADVEVDPRETSLRDGVIVRGSDEPHLEQDINPEIQAEIDKCFAYADALRDRGIDVGVVVEAEGAVEVTYETLGDLVQRFHDHTEVILVHHIRVIEGVQGEHGHKNVGIKSAVTALTERIAELERDNRRLRDTASVETVAFSDDHSVGNSYFLYFETNVMTHGEIEDLIARRVAEEIEAREAAMNLEPLNENGDELEGGKGNGGNGGNGNRGNGGNRNRGNGGNENEGNGENGNEGNGGNGNGGNGENENGNRNMNHGTEGVVGLTRWFEKMETVFNISNCPSKYQVKYATCILQDSALTWWNTHKRTIGVEAAYAMNWAGLMRRMVPDEEDKDERFIGGLPDNIQGNVIAAEPTKLQDAIRIANNLMDQKLKGYARSAENKRSLENNPRDNRGQQPVFKRQNVRGQNVARAYTAGNNKRKRYVGPLPYCNKCRLHHEGLCTIRCGNCKKVGHLTRDCRAAVAPNTQRAAVGNQPGVICYECGRLRHFRKDCPKLRNQLRGN
ncbi:putative reverse transcriptase domain-containing protein [Tanacetum coccineum]|uniref:Reverse transcriptase domain-containing protein n=1 Tax=Tanacetum coccineum TaxID=301880 RepID=A0ABQ5BBZ7_9ASTR